LVTIFEFLIKKTEKNVEVSDITIHHDHHNATHWPITKSLFRIAVPFTHHSDDTVIVKELLFLTHFVSSSHRASANHSPQSPWLIKPGCGYKKSSCG
jgi:hypothetical protein